MENSDDKNVQVIQPQNTAITPMVMLHMAVQQGADIDKLEKLMALQERYEKNEATKAFNQAMGEFKALGITVSKDSRVSYTTDKGTTEYVHASLGNVCNVLGPAMAKYGLSYRWSTNQGEGGRIKVTCIISHRLGHSESVSLESGPDTSGGKNNIQAIGSTVQYLQRYTLLAATGTATEYDDDGRGSGGDQGDQGQTDNKKKTDGRTELPECTEAKFDEMCVDVMDKSDPGKIKRMGWKSLVTSGTKTADHLIGMLETKYILNENQKAVIRGWATPQKEGN